MSKYREDALEYHRTGRPGKIEVVSTKPFTTQRDLSLAYTPGVADPCLEIERDPELAYSYTAKGNLVAVVTNGSAVLGLGDIGALASKPVMEGKAVLFKRFADIDVFDIELDTNDPDELIRTVKMLEPTFGGINLEDIKAPESFYIESRLRAEMNIPVFHDDQHGTAIISGAALLNALQIVGKKIEDVRVVYNGAGAAAIACAKLHITLGMEAENLLMCDSKGVIYKGREEGMNEHKEQFAAETEARSLADALEGADIFIGLSVKDALTPDMLKSMAPSPVVFALANPDPEIEYHLALNTREDVLLATGRSDYPNQVNNVLGFPFIFRGALDVRATGINEEMKIAATHALAGLAHEDVPKSVLNAYGLKELGFSAQYIIPKPLDPRVPFWVAPAVAQAAMASGVARNHMDMDEYREALEKRLGGSREVIRTTIQNAKTDPRRIVFPEGTQEKILRASKILLDEGIAYPIVLGSSSEINARLEKFNLDIPDLEIEDPLVSSRLGNYVEEYFRLRQRKGVTRAEAEKQAIDPNVFGAMMVHLGDADGLVSGLTQHYPETLRPALQIIGTRDEVEHVSGLYLMVLKNKVYCFADTTVNIDPTAEVLAEIAIESARLARTFHIEPRVAMLSFSNFGSARHHFSNRVREAVRIVKGREPALIIDGEMHVDTATNPTIAHQNAPFSEIQGDANILIFPDLQSGNIAYKLLQELGGAEAIGPILMGMKKSVHVLQQGCDVNSIVNMAAIAVLDAQTLT
jgi:malate dehydrogenase (oxaloacetate-decarboxylating)(NADP+)